MRARLLLATILLLAVPATARAQLPEANQKGIRVSRGTGGRVAISFLDTTAGRRAYRRYAGRTVTIRCQSIADRAFGAGPVGVATAKVHFRRTLSTLRLRLRGNVNLCTFGSVSVATDAAARRFLADLALADVLPGIAGRAARAGAAAEARRLGRGGVVLSSPASTPRRGRIGVYARGGVVAAVGVSASGRRMFFRTQRDAVRTNVLAPLDQLGPASVPPGVRLPSGDVPPAGTPLPDTTDPEITARREGADAVVDFTGAARDELGDKHVMVACSASSGAATTSSHAPPAAGRPLRVPVAARYHLCAVSYGQRFARVALDTTGRAALEDGTVAAALQRVLRTAGGAATPGYPSAQALSDSLSGAVVPLVAPTDNPPDLRIGAWSDSAAKLTLVAVARTGRRLFFEVEGDVVRSNVFSVPDLP